MSIKEITIKLLLAIFISGCIGFDREFKNRPAGIRTHILVCVGATIIALIQTQLALQAIDRALTTPELIGVLRVDEARLTAQVVSGIGFLGAGTIIVTKRDVKGLTTAASLWTVAGLGIALGMGMYQIAIIGFCVVLTVLSTLTKIIVFPSLKRIEIKYTHRKPTKDFIASYFEKHHIHIRDVKFDMELTEEKRIYTNIYTVELPKKLDYTEIVESISYYDNIIRIQLISV